MMTRQTVAGVLAAAVLGAAAVVPLFGQEALRRIAPRPPVEAEKPAEPRAASTAPATQDAGVAGEPGMAPKPPKPAEPGSPMDRAADSGAQVYVDDSFTSVEKLRTALRYARQGQDQLAISEFQKIVDEFGQKLVYLNNDSFISITDYVREQLLKMPAVRDGMYDTLYGAVATKNVDAAIEQRDLPDLVRTCDRYFPSSAALKGLSLAAEWYFERGEFSSAARTWRQLLTHPAAKDAQRAEFLHHAGVAEKLGGRDEVAKGLRDRLAREYPDASGTVAGESVSLVESLNGILKHKAWEAVSAPVDEWPMFGGDASRRANPDVNASAGARLWSVSLQSEAIIGENAARRKNVDPNNPIMIRRGMGFRGMPGGDEAAMQSMLSSHPTLSNGTLFVHAGERIAAISGNAGTLLWVYPTQVIARDASNAMMYNPYGGAMRMSNFDSCSVFEDKVFAVLPAQAVAVQPTGGRFGYYAPAMGGQTRIAAISRTDGKEAWSTPASKIKVEGGGVLVFVGSPVVTRQGVFCMARKMGGDSFTQLYLVRLDRDSGNVTWTCYLCSAGGAGYGYSPTANRIPIPTIVDDVVYISTGQNADCAVDANAGRILWLQITEGAKGKPNAAPYSVVNYEALPSWKFAPPLVHQDKLITYEIGSKVRIYDRWAGKVLSSIDRKDMANVEVLAGIHGETLVSVGATAVRGLNLKTNKEAWSVDPPEGGGKLSGRPFMAKELLYVPYDKGLLMVDLVKGARVDFSQWPRTEKNEAGKPGNILVTSEQIVVVTDNEVAGYSRWETARDNRLARIKAEPTNPEPYLALAEISFRTNHFDLAEENMKKSVELAVNPAAPAQEELRQRLYRTNLSFAEQLLEKKETALRDRARFYFDQTKMTAYNPESQAEWRLSMSALSLAQQRWDEAAGLYNAVLNDSAMRTAPYRKADALSRAGVSAEIQMRSLIERLGKEQVTLAASDPAYAEKVDEAGRAAVYKPYEALASSALGKARSDNGAGRAAAMNAVVESFPNSRAAIEAAGEAARAMRDKNPAEAIKVLRWMYPRVQGATRAQVTADLAETHAALNRWTAALAWADRGFRQFKDVQVTSAAARKQVAFAALRDDLRAKVPASIEGRRPSLPLPRRVEGESSAKLVMADQGNKEYTPPMVAKGLLLTPIEQAASNRRPDLFFVLGGSSIRMFNAALEEPWTKKGVEKVPLPSNAPTVLLGTHGDLAVLVQADRVFAIDTAAGTVKWSQELTLPADEFNKYQELSNRIKALQQQEMSMRGVGMVYDPETGAAYNPAMSPVALAQDPDTGRNIAFANGLGRLQFNTMRMIAGKLVTIVGQDVMAYDLATGEKAWKDRSGAPLASVKLPDGLPSALLGNDDVIVVQVDNERGMPIFRVLETASGKFVGEVKMDEERSQWRGLSEDGILFVVGEQSVAAYDCFNLGADGKRALWRREDLRTRFPTASAITLDGLVMLNGNSELVCLSAEGGEYRWPVPPALPARIDLPLTGNANYMGGIMYVRAFVDGDQVIYQSSQGMSAYFTADGSLSWKSAMNSTPNGYPPLGITQFADPYVLSVAAGQTATGERQMRFLAHDRRAGFGRLCMNQRMTREKGGGDPPIVRQWQVIDNAILMEIAANNSVNVYAYQAKGTEEK